MIGSILDSLCFLIYQAALRTITADLLPLDKRRLGFGIIGMVPIPSPIVTGILYANYELIRGIRLTYLIAMIMFLIAATIRIIYTSS